MKGETRGRMWCVRVCPEKGSGGQCGSSAPRRAVRRSSFFLDMCVLAGTICPGPPLRCAGRRGIQCRRHTAGNPTVQVGRPVQGRPVQPRCVCHSFLYSEGRGLRLDELKRCPAALRGAAPARCFHGEIRGQPGRYQTLRRGASAGPQSRCRISHQVSLLSPVRACGRRHSARTVRMAEGFAICGHGVMVARMRAWDPRPRLRGERRWACPHGAVTRNRNAGAHASITRRCSIAPSKTTTKHSPASPTSA